MAQRILSTKLRSTLRSRARNHHSAYYQCQENAAIKVIKSHAGFQAFFFFPQMVSVANQIRALLQLLDLKKLIKRTSH